jgi:hypothetical protein
VTLVFFSVRIPFQVDEFQPPTAWHCPCFLLHIVSCAEFGENLLRSGDYFFKLLEFPADEYPDCVLTISIRMLDPVTDGSIRLPTAPRTSEEDFENGTRNQSRLLRLRFPDYGLDDFL